MNASEGAALIATAGGHSTQWSAAAAVIIPEPWVQDALCAQTDPEMFFPEKGGTTAPAKKVCAACTVADQCLEFAMRSDERFGIWGGASERQRRRMRPPRNQHEGAFDDLAVVAEFERLYEEGLNDVAIARRLDLASATVSKYRRARGLVKQSVRKREMAG